MTNREIIYAAVALFVVCLLLYAYGLAPTVTLVDSGELITAAYVKGVAHPPGFPTYLLISHLFTLIPVGNVAQRVNFVSTLFGAACIMIFFLLCISTCDIYFYSCKNRSQTKKKKDTPSDNRYKTYAAVLASLLLATSSSLWSYAEIAEVYTMNLCFILLTFYFLLQAYKERVLNKNADHKYVYLAALTFGLNLGIHHITVILMAPAFLYIMLKTTRYSFFKTKKMLLSFIFLLLGISTYSYLILASRNKPILNWGNPDNLERFLRHVSAWQYRSNISINPAQVSNEFKDYISLHIQQFGFIAVLIIIAGLIIAFKDKFLRYLFILVLICNLSYGVLYSIAEDKDAYYLPTYAFECILFSLTVLKYCKSKNKSLKLMIYLISVGSILIPFQSKIQILPKNDYYIGEKYVNDTLASMPQAGIFLTQDWQIYAPLFYFQQVYSKRPDIIAIDVNLLKRSWYVEYIYQHYPEIAKYSKAEIESFLQQVVKFEKGLPYNSVEIQKAYIDLINSFINYARTSDKAAYLGLVIEEGIADALYRIPTGLVFYLSETNFKYISAPDIDVSSLTFIKYQKDKVINEKVLPFYAAMLIKRGIYLNRMGMHDEALRQYHRALELKKDKDTYELLADSYLLLGDKSKARFYYKYIIDNYGSTPQIEKKLTATMQ